MKKILILILIALTLYLAYLYWNKYNLEEIFYDFLRQTIVKIENVVLRIQPNKSAV